MRVFYEVEKNDQRQDDQPEVPGIVFVLAVGKKEGNVLWIAGKRVIL